MKKFFATRLVTILIAVLAVTLVSGVVTLAANMTPKALPITGAIIAANPDIAFFSDAACTVPVSQLNYGDMIQGTAYPMDVYVKNIGNKALITQIWTSDLDPAVGTLTLPSGISTIAVNASTKVTITFTPKVGGPLGPLPIISVGATY